MTIEEKIHEQAQAKLIDMMAQVIREQADLIALLKAQLKAKEEGDVCM